LASVEGLASTSLSVPLLWVNIIVIVHADKSMPKTILKSIILIILTIFSSILIISLIISFYQIIENKDSSLYPYYTTLSGEIYMAMEQLQLFEMTETDRLSQKIQGCISATDNLRRGMFSRHDVLFKMYSELKDEIEEAKREIAQLRARLAVYNQDNFIPQEIAKLETRKLVRFCP
jgi:hypothetical protein